MILGSFHLGLGQVVELQYFKNLTNLLAIIAQTSKFIIELNEALEKIPKDKIERDTLEEKEGENLEEKQKTFFTEISVINVLNVLNTFFGNVDEETSLEKMVVLLNKIYTIQKSDLNYGRRIGNSSEFDYTNLNKNTPGVFRVKNYSENEDEDDDTKQVIEGGKKRNKNRKTRRNRK